MTYHLLYEATPWHKRAALFDEQGNLLTLRVDELSRPLIEGAVVWGRVRRVEKALGAAFVDIGDVGDALLPLKTVPGGKLTEGLGVLVRIVRGGFAEKGAQLDGRVANKAPPKETPTPKLLQPALTALRRALHDAGAHPVTCWIPDARLRDEVASTFNEKSIRQLNFTGQGDDADDALTWYERLDDELDRIMATAAVFPFKGGHVITEITSAVATIDVNSAMNGSTARGMTRPEAILAVNLGAAESVARLCRLLDLGGSVIVDFITPPSKGHRQIVTDHLLATFQTTDDKIVEVRPMSRFGLVELNRERTGPSLPLLLRLPAYVAGRILLQLWRQPAGHNPRLREQTITAAPEVIAHLKPLLTAEVCFMHLGRTIQLVAAPGSEGGRYQITG